MVLVTKFNTARSCLYWCFTSVLIHNLFLKIKLKHNYCELNESYELYYLDTGFHVFYGIFNGSELVCIASIHWEPVQNAWQRVFNGQNAPRLPQAGKLIIRVSRFSVEGTRVVEFLHLVHPVEFDDGLVDLFGREVVSLLVHHRVYFVDLQI